ncbi:MAG: diaminopimelate epimerase [Chloroflexi bacterium]|nr:diaminopimelate epimerase [Chloroflexota bacterium]
MKFAKLQATGNDFVLVEAEGLDCDWPRLAEAMCQRRFGIGGDGLMLLLKSKVADFRMRIFNSDGSEAEVCGNGLRCFARYVIDRGLARAGKEISIETTAGIRRVRPEGDGRFEVNMGIPKFGAEEIPVAISADRAPILDYPLHVQGTDLLLSFVSMGNPHGVCFVKELSDFPLPDLGPIVVHHELFPQGLNFEVASVASRKEIKARVWERGVGETLSCGSGACAIAVTAMLHSYVDRWVDVILPGGRLTVGWDGKGGVYLRGEAALVFTGDWLRRNLVLEEQ